MLILLLETKNSVNGKALRLMRGQDGDYEIWRGKYGPQQTETARWEPKGKYTDLDNALGVYLTLIKGIVK